MAAMATMGAMPGTPRREPSPAGEHGHGVGFVL
jgi:hypothetical protein